MQPTSPTPTQPRRLAGGSEAQRAADSYDSVISIVADGVPLIMPHDKKVGHRVRFKPGFNESLSPSDPNRVLSYMPYRDRSRTGESGTYGFTNWFTVVQAYRYFGNNNFNFVSPTTRPKGVGFTDAERADPVAHIRAYCKNKPHLKYLIDRPDPKQEQPTAPGEKKKYAKAAAGWPESVALYNVVSMHNAQQHEEDGVLMLPLGGHKHLLTQLDAGLTVVAQAMADPNWPEYLLGDQTCPFHGGWATVQKHQIGNGTTSPWCALWSQNPGTLDAAGLRKQPLTEAQMRARWDLMSEETIHIASYQRLVDLIIMDGAIPREVVAQACGAMADIPGNGAPTPTYQTAVTGGMYAGSHADDQIPGLPGGPAFQPQTFQPQAQAPAFQPQAPAFQPQAQTFQPQAQAPAFQPQAQTFQPQAPAFQPQAPAFQPQAQAPAFQPQAQTFQPQAANTGFPAAFPAAQGFQPAAAPASPFAPASLGMTQPQGFLNPAAPPQAQPQAQAAGQPFAGAAAPSPFAGAARSLAQPVDTPFTAAPPSPNMAPAAPQQFGAPAPAPAPAPEPMFWIVVNGATSNEIYTLAQAASMGATHVQAKDNPQGWVEIATAMGRNQGAPAAPPAAPPAAFQAPAQAQAPVAGKLSAAEFQQLQHLQQLCNDPAQVASIDMHTLGVLGTLQQRYATYGAESA